jgi:plastocyanin
MVNKGDKIVFINHDMVTHNVTEATGKILAIARRSGGKIVEHDGS